MSAEIPTGYRLPLVSETNWRLPDLTMQAIANDLGFNQSDVALAERQIAELPATVTSPPTITYGSTRTISARIQTVQGSSITPVGAYLNWDPTLSKMTVRNLAGYDLYFDGTDLEFGWVSQGSSGDRVWVWIDGQPVGAVPTTSPLVTTPGQNCYGKIAFGSRVRRRITVYMTGIDAVSAFGHAITDLVTPAPRKLRLAVISDSFAAGSTGNNQLQTFPFWMGQELGVDIGLLSYGGSGYLSTGGSNTFGSAGRLADCAKYDPDMILFFGSRNDSLSGLQSAAEATYAAYTAQHPGVPIIVAGVQPGNDTDTVSSGFAQINDAVRQAALASPSVIGFIDLLGAPTATAPAAYSAGTTYNAGDLVAYQGSYWENVFFGATSLGVAPGASSRWELATSILSGTGRVGALGSDGTRDVYLNTDDVHLTAAGSWALSQTLSFEVRRLIRAATG